MEFVIAADGSLFRVAGPDHAGVERHPHNKAMITAFMGLSVIMSRITAGQTGLLNEIMEIICKQTTGMS